MTWTKTAMATRIEPFEFHAYGGAAKVQLAREREVLTDGPAGTGKTRNALELVNRLMAQYPGAKAVMCRKTRVSLTQTTMETFHRFVLPGNPFKVQWRAQEQEFRYPNGSKIIVTGLEEPERTKSLEADLIYVNEATELEENDWELLLRALRNGVLPAQQLLGDCNPGPPRHWLKLRCDQGKTRRIVSRYEDNPAMWDAARGDWTEPGAAYIAILDGLTGVRYKRLRLGLWAAAEGIIYEGWDAARHLIERFEIPSEWRRFVSIDFGFTNPFVCQWWAMDPDERLYRYRELYGTQRLVEDWAKEIKRLSAGETIEAYVCDHDAEDRATLEKHLGARTTLAVKAVSPGIQAVQARLKPAGDGKPRLFLLKNSLVERDPLLEDRKKPCCTEEEIENYIWRVKPDGKRYEEPVKQDDHGCDGLRYLVAHFDLAEPRLMERGPRIF